MTFHYRGFKNEPLSSPFHPTLITPRVKLGASCRKVTTGPWKVVTTEVRSVYRKLKNWQSTENLLFTVSRKRTNPPQAFGLFWPFSEKLVKPRSASSAGLPQGFTSLQYSVQYWAEISRFPENQEILQTLCLQRMVGDFGGTLCTSDLRVMRTKTVVIPPFWLITHNIHLGIVN